MNYRAQLLKAARIWEKKTKKSRSTAANAVAQDGKFFDRIEKGGGCTVDTYEKVMAWFAENTPKH